MSIPRSSDRQTPSARDAGRSIYETAIDVVLTGVAVIVPLVVTVYVLNLAFEFVFSALNPVVKLLEWAGLIEWVSNLPVVRFLLSVDIVTSEVQFVTEVIALVILAAGVVAVGLAARVSYGETLIDYFDTLVAAVPGVGAVYKSFRRMSDVMLESEVRNFQDVKLVEFPREGTYTVGFKTADSPASVRRSTGHGEMETLFLPLAPNPVMGGFLAHVPAERVLDVDMTIEEGVRSIITSGIAAGETDSEMDLVSDLEDAVAAATDESGRPERDGDVPVVTLDEDRAGGEAGDAEDVGPAGDADGDGDGT
jgi:uncharacterized membrane protein